MGKKIKTYVVRYKFEIEEEATITAATAQEAVDTIKNMFRDVEVVMATEIKHG